MITMRGSARNVYVVLTGSLEVNDGDHPIAVLLPGDVFGETAYLLHQARTKNVDVLTDGKAIFGVGLGYSAHEFAAFGVEPGTRVARFEEALALVRALWSGETVNFQGRFFTVEGAPGGATAAGRRPAGLDRRAGQRSGARFCRN